MSAGAWRAWMKAAVEAEGLATAGGLASSEALDALDDDARRLLGGLLDAATSALAAEDAALRAAFAHPRWALNAIPPERRSARGLGGWVFEQVLVYAIYKEWVRAAPVAWDETEPGGRRRPDLLVFDEGWPRARFAVEAKWWGEGERGIVLDAVGLRDRSAARGATPLLVTFLYARRRELEAAMRAAVLPDGVEPVHLGVFPCEIYTRWAPPAWREPGAFAVVTFAVGG